MSRITEAFARAQGTDTPQTAEISSAWDFGPAASPTTQDPWNFEVAPPPRIELPKVARQAPIKEASAIRRVDPSPAYAERLIVSSNMPPQVVEQYKALGAALHHVQQTEGVRVVMVASALPGEGKTLVASNLAITLSGSYGRRVLLIDADLHRPSLHTAFGVQNADGLGDRLGEAGRSPGLPLPIVPLASTLDLLPAGSSQADPIRVVTGTGMRQLITEVSRRYDWVIIDTPPVAVLTDANLLAAIVDRVLFVIQAGKTKYEAIQTSLERLGKERIIGTVLNRAEPSGDKLHAYEQYYTRSS